MPEYKWKIFKQACKIGTEEGKLTRREIYIKAQKDHREQIERQEENQTKQRLGRLTSKVRLNPNIIWQIRKWAKTNNELEILFTL